MPRAAAPVPPVAPRVNPAQFVHGLLGAGENEFAGLARLFREELAARDLLEVLQIDLILLALGMLRRSLAGRPEVDPKTARARAQAHKMLAQSLREFTRLRKRPDAVAPAAAAAEAPPEAAVASPPEPARVDRPRPNAVPRPLAATARPLADPFDDLRGAGPAFVDLAIGRPRVGAARTG